MSPSVWGLGRVEDPHIAVVAVQVWDPAEEHSPCIAAAVVAVEAYLRTGAVRHAVLLSLDYC